MSMRVVMSGVAGSAAVLAIAVTSLGAVRAEADSKSAKSRPAAVVLGGRETAPAAAPAKPLGPQTAWLKRLLSRSDLEPAGKRS